MTSSKSSRGGISEAKALAFIDGRSSYPQAERAMEEVAGGLGTSLSGHGERVIRAITAMSLGVSPESVAKRLAWKEFESFCAKVLQESGYSVEENVTLTKPRAQIDIVATGRSHVLSVDCKHWERAHSPSALASFASAQKRRSELYRRAKPEAKPVVSVILSFSQPEGGFVEGVPVVPVRSLMSFLGSIEAYSELIDTR